MCSIEYYPSVFTIGTELVDIQAIQQDTDTAKGFKSCP